MKNTNTKKEKLRGEFERQLLHEYVILWNGGGSDRIANNDQIEMYMREKVDQWAIITAANPDGKKLTTLENWKLNEELRIFLTLLDIEFHKVERESIDTDRFEPDGVENVDAFLIVGVTEHEAREIALQHQQEHFVYFEMDPTVTVTLVGCGKRFGGMRATIFAYKD